MIYSLLTQTIYGIASPSLKKASPGRSSDCRKRPGGSWAFCSKCVKIKEGDKNDENKSKRKRILEIFSIEEFVPQEHLLRKIDSAVDFTHI